MTDDEKVTQFESNRHLAKRLKVAEAGRWGHSLEMAGGGGKELLAGFSGVLNFCFASYLPVGGGGVLQRGGGGSEVGRAGGMRHTSTALYFYGASKKSLHKPRATSENMLFYISYGFNYYLQLLFLQFLSKTRLNF
jgi:hypothetical protein